VLRSFIILDLETFLHSFPYRCGTLDIEKFYICRTLRHLKRSKTYAIHFTLNPLRYLREGERGKNKMAEASFAVSAKETPSPSLSRCPPQKRKPLPFFLRKRGNLSPLPPQLRTLPFLPFHPHSSCENPSINSTGLYLRFDTRYHTNGCDYFNSEVQSFVYK
jgi:hypothetical protein